MAEKGVAPEKSDKPEKSKAEKPQKGEKKAVIVMLMETAKVKKEAP